MKPVNIVYVHICVFDETVSSIFFLFTLDTNVNSVSLSCPDMEAS